MRLEMYLLFERLMHSRSMRFRYLYLFRNSSTVVFSRGPGSCHDAGKGIAIVEKGWELRWLWVAGKMAVARLRLL
jgi:hypothetical protein